MIVHEMTVINRLQEVVRSEFDRASRTESSKEFYKCLHSGRYAEELISKVKNNQRLTHKDYLYISSAFGPVVSAQSAAIRGYVLGTIIHERGDIPYLLHFDEFELWTLRTLLLEQTSIVYEKAMEGLSAEEIANSDFDTEPTTKPYYDLYCIFDMKVNVRENFIVLSKDQVKLLAQVIDKAYRQLFEEDPRIDNPTDKDEVIRHTKVYLQQVLQS